MKEASRLLMAKRIVDGGLALPAPEQVRTCESVAGLWRIAQLLLAIHQVRSHFDDCSREMEHAYRSLCDERSVDSFMVLTQTL